MAEQLSHIAMYHAKMEKGMNMLFNNQLEEAESFFAKSKDQIPRFSLHHAEVSVFRSAISELAVHRQEAIKRLNETIALAQEHLKILAQGNLPKGNEHIPMEELPNFALDNKIVLADAYTMLAVQQILEDVRLKGVLNLRKGWKIYRETHKEIKANESKYDTVVHNVMKFGVGLFYFILALIPPGLPQKAAAMAGFKGGDKDLGLQYLRDCYASNTIRSSLAGFVLCINHLLVAPSIDPNTKSLILEAEKIIESSIEKFPQGSIFHATFTVACLEENKPDKGLEMIKKAIENCKHITDYPAVFMRLESNCYAMKLDWTKTAEILNETLEKGLELEKKNGKSMNVWAFSWNNIRLATCCAMLGQNDRAKKLFEVAEAGKSKDRWSQMLGHQAHKYIKNGAVYSFLEIMMLEGVFEKLVNHSNQEQRDSVLSIIEKLAKDAPGALDTKLASSKSSDKGSFMNLFSKKSLNNSKVDYRVTYLALRGIVLRSMGKTAEALNDFNEILTLSPHLQNDKMYIAIGNLQIGKTIFQNDKETAVKHLEAAIKIPSFNWDVQIKTQARIYLRQLGVEYKPSEVEEETDNKTLEDDVDMAELLEEKDDSDELKS
jgi:tetratricopeptide (TPR) repeat protein